MQTGNQTVWDKQTLQGGSNAQISSASVLRPTGESILLFSDQMQPNTLSLWSFWQCCKGSVHQFDAGPPSCATSSSVIYQKTHFSFRLKEQTKMRLNGLFYPTLEALRWVWVASWKAGWEEEDLAPSSHISQYSIMRTHGTRKCFLMRFHLLR